MGYFIYVSFIDLLMYYVMITKWTDSSRFHPIPSTFVTNTLQNLLPRIGCIREKAKGSKLSYMCGRWHDIFERRTFRETFQKLRFFTVGTNLAKTSKADVTRAGWVCFCVTVDILLVTGIQWPIRSIFTIEVYRFVDSRIIPRINKLRWAN